MKLCTGSVYYGGADLRGTYENGQEAKAEVKTIRNFGMRDNDPKDAPCQFGTIPFELYSVDRQRAGWLYEYMHPTEYNANLVESGNTRILYCKPTILAYLLVKGTETPTPYAAVVFEDVGKLFDRLKRISPWALEATQWGAPKDCNWRGIRYARDGMESYVIVNMWHIPLNFLSDIATVTIAANG